MKLVKQKNNVDCLVTSLFMLNDNKDYRRIKKFCKKYLEYSPNKGQGTHVDHKTICYQLRLLGIDAYLAPEGKKSIGAHTKYNRAMILLYTEKKGHCVAWNGYCCFDPDCDKPYPERLMKQKVSFTGCVIIVIKTPFFERVLSFIKKPFYEAAQH